MLLKKRHRLSTKCIDDILGLLNSLDVRNTPSSWHTVKKLLNESKPTSINCCICPACSQHSVNRQVCSNCSTSQNERVPSFQSFSITEQIEKIIVNNDDLDFFYDSQSTALRDVRDGSVFKSLRRTTTDKVLTLTLNIDGIQPSRNARSTIWPILMVINDLPPHRRFALENLILAGVWSAKSKPSRDDARSFLQPMIDELRNLEKGHLFRTSADFHQFIRVYLISACCDKPAQALIQCISEPIAAYGCGRCEVPG